MSTQVLARSMRSEEVSVRPTAVAQPSALPDDPSWRADWRDLPAGDHHCAPFDELPADPTPSGAVPHHPGLSPHPTDEDSPSLAPDSFSPEPSDPIPASDTVRILRLEDFPSEGALLVGRDPQCTIQLAHSTLLSRFHASIFRGDDDTFLVIDGTLEPTPLGEVQPKPSTNGVYWLDTDREWQRIEGMMTLNGGDRIRLGPSSAYPELELPQTEEAGLVLDFVEGFEPAELILEAADPFEVEAENPGAASVDESAPLPGEQPIAQWFTRIEPEAFGPDGSLTIGRSTKPDGVGHLALPESPQVSARHAAIQYDEQRGSYLILDGKVRNGQRFPSTNGTFLWEPDANFAEGGHWRSISTKGVYAAPGSLIRCGDYIVELPDGPPRKPWHPQMPAPAESRPEVSPVQEPERHVEQKPAAARVDRFLERSALGERWRLRATLDDAVESALATRPRRLRHEETEQRVEVFAGTDTERRVLGNALAHLAASGTPLPQRIVVVDEIGHFPDNRNWLGRPEAIRALPVSAEGTLVIARPALASLKAAQALMQDIGDRQSLADRVDQQERMRTVMAVAQRERHAVITPPDAHAPHGRYGPLFAQPEERRPIIGRALDGVIGGVYISSATSRNPTTVTAPPGGALDREFRELHGRLRPNDSPETIMRKVREHVERRMPYWHANQHGNIDADEAARLELGRQLNRTVSPHDMLDLEVYLRLDDNRGGGVCAQQALFAAYLIERLRDEKILDGSVHLGRNQVSQVVDGQESWEAHAWARYVGRNGQVIIVDPAQHYSGPVEASPDQWVYATEDDMAAVAQQPY